MNPKHPDGMANSVDPDQTASVRSSLVRICSVCSDLYVQMFRLGDIAFTLNATNGLYVFLGHRQHTIQISWPKKQTEI